MHESTARTTTDLELEREKLRPALRFIRENFRDGPGLVEIAASVGYSPFHFHRRFTACFGVTPKGETTRLQIEEAKRLLAESELELREIGERLGFAHQSHFTSRFNLVVGRTPGRYRRACRLERAMQRAA